MDSGFSSTLANTCRSVTETVRLAGWGKRRKIKQLMRIGPPPLIHPGARAIVVFSPKSACTSVVIWFLHQIGHAQRAREHHHWPHRYRIDLYYASEHYRDACRLDLTDFRVVRVMRDSFDRAASSFRHLLRSRLPDETLAELLGRSDAAETGVSFCEFLDMLERIDLTTCDEHHRIQRHPIEDLLPVTHLINVSTEDLFVRLNQVEADLGLPITDFDELEWIHSLDRRRNRFDGKLNTADAYNVRLTRTNARRGPWPPYRALLTAPARERIARLYAVDIAAYGQSSAMAPAPGRSIRG